MPCEMCHAVQMKEFKFLKYIIESADDLWKIIRTSFPGVCIRKESLEYVPTPNTVQCIRLDIRFLIGLYNITVCIFLE